MVIMCREKRRNTNLCGINVIKMPVWPTLGIMFIGHNISAAGLLTPLRVGTKVIMVTKVTMGTEWLDDLCSAGVGVVVVWLCAQDINNHSIKAQRVYMEKIEMIQDGIKSERHSMLKRCLHSCDWNINLAFWHAKKFPRGGLFMPHTTNLSGRRVFFEALA